MPVSPREENLDIVGQVNDIVYYVRSGIKTQRAHFIPVQPGTPAQLAWWQVFRTGVQQWQALTPIQKAVYNQDAKPLHISGFNLYMRNHLNS